MNWRITILTATGTQRATYTNTSNAITSRITYELEPSGNCLTASFNGIPRNVNVQAGDWAQILIENVPVWYGYFSNVPSRDSYEEATYTLEGAKSRLYDYQVEQYWFRGTPNSASLTSHRQIVDSLVGFLPVYLLNQVENLASTTFGNKPPIIANDYPLGDLLDQIIGSASTPFDWGVGADRRLFVKPALNTTVLNLDSVANKRVELLPQNAEGICTEVKFIFTIPTSFYPADFNRDFRMIDSSFYESPISDSAPVTYTYSDPSATTYGRITKVVPLILSDSWLREFTWANAAASEANASVGNFIGAGLVTQSGGTDAAAKLAAVSTRGTGSYIQNPAVVTGATGGRLTVQANGTSVLRNGNIVGCRVRYGITGTTRVPNLRMLTRYALEPYYARDMYFPSGTQTPGSQSDITMSFIFPNLTLPDWGTTNPFAIFSGSRRNSSITVFDMQFQVLSSLRNSSETLPNLPAGGLRIYEWFVLALNTDALDGFAKTQIKTPAQIAANVMVKQDYGFRNRAQITLNNTTREEDVTRIIYTLGVNEGYQVTYVLGKDERRSNEFLEKLTKRDQRATANAVVVTR